MTIANEKISFEVSVAINTPNQLYGVHCGAL